MVILLFKRQKEFRQKVMTFFFPFFFYFYSLCLTHKYALSRSKLAIIPQDPFLFSSSVRENLDPCGRQSEHRLIEALEQCHLGDVVQRIGMCQEGCPIYVNYVFEKFHEIAQKIYFLVFFPLLFVRRPGCRRGRKGKISFSWPKAAALSSSGPSD